LFDPSSEREVRFVLVPRMLRRAEILDSKRLTVDSDRVSEDYFDRSRIENEPSEEVGTSEDR
jgi:hypothetical protein